MATIFPASADKPFNPEKRGKQMPRSKIKWIISLLFLMISALVLNGCATSTTGPSAGAEQSQYVGSGRIENMLLKAGFETVPNEHPYCSPLCGRLSAGQIIPFKRPGQTVYGYLSPSSGRLLVGNETEYQQFINLAVMQKISEQQRPVLGTPETDPEFWNMWRDLYGGK